MIKEKKIQILEELKTVFSTQKVIYFTDWSNLDAKATSNLKRDCHEEKAFSKVFKNTLIKRAMESITERDFSPFLAVLSGNTCIITAEVNSTPARIMKKFRDKTKEKRPILKGAYIEESFYMGDEQLANLVHIKTKEELLGDLISVLQSPIKNVLSALESGGQKISGALKTLSEKS